MVARILPYKILHDPTYLGKGGVNFFWTKMILPFELLYKFVVRISMGMLWHSNEFC